MISSFDDVYSESKIHDVDMRSAAYIVGLKRICEAMKAKDNI